MKRVLVAPLDWGLGHATRSVPVIRELLRRKCEVTIAGSGQSLVLLQREFPQLDSAILPAYDPVYPSRGSMVWRMAAQLPKFLHTIRLEHDMTEMLVRDRNFDIIISDNRFGAWSGRAYSVFITHQSNILMPKRFGWLQPWVRWLNHRYMKRFSRCWIPDYPSGVAEKLIAFGKVPAAVEVEFVGPLSRFRASVSSSIRYDVAVILSGPEPQRTIFERIVVPQLKGSGLRYVVVRGLPGDAGAMGAEPVFQYLTTEKLQEVLAASALVIARSGYSTIMDLMALNKNAVLVPTPGQTEQEYLAKRLREQRICFTASQDRFDLREAIEEGRKYQGFAAVEMTDDLLLKAMDRLGI